MSPHLAYAIACNAHRGQRYGDRPYFDEHVLAVAQRVIEAGGSNDAIVVAYLHDVLEDTAVRMHELVEQGLTIDQQRALRAITRTLGEGYPEYLVRVKANTIAALVKRCDLEANLAAVGTLREPLRRRYLAAHMWLTELPPRVNPETAFSTQVPQ